MFFPDVLDHLGKTPREFGAFHVHFEAVETVDRGLYVARVLLQAAFEPVPDGARLELADGATRVEFTQVALPPLVKGEVVRFSVPFRAREAPKKVALCLLDADVDDAAERVRPAWKLSDTIEAPKEARVRGNRGGGFFSAGFTDDLGNFYVGDAPVGATISTPMKRHRARELSSFLLVDVSSVAARAMSEPTCEVLWAPGRALPEAPRLFATPVQQTARTTRRCRACDFEGPSSEFGNATVCPMCDAMWL